MIFFLAASESTFIEPSESAAAAVKATALFLKETEAIVIIVIVPSKAEYGLLLDIVNQQGAQTTLEQRRQFAERAFGVSSHYDTAIHSWFAKH